MGRVTVDVEFSGIRTPEVFEEFLDAVMEQLDRIGREADVEATLSAVRNARFDLYTPDVSDDDSDDELIRALADLRTALHSVNCSTPGWPTGHQIVQANVEPQQPLPV